MNRKGRERKDIVKFMNRKGGERRDIEKFMY